MTRNIALTIGAVLLAVTAGCKAPTPVFDPLAGYGRATVPPPATGSFGRPDNYYNGGAAPAANQGSQLMAAPAAAYASNVNPPAVASPATLNQNAGNVQPGGLNWRAAGSTDAAPGTLNVAATPPSLTPAVQQASHTMPSQTMPSHNLPMQPVAPATHQQFAGNAPSTLAIDGMRVNDATLDTRTTALPLMRHYPATGTGYPAAQAVLQQPAAPYTAQPVTSANAPQVLFPQSAPALPPGTPVNTPYGTGYVLPAGVQQALVPVQQAVPQQATPQPVTVQPALAPIEPPAATPATSGLQWHSR